MSDLTPIQSRVLLFMREFLATEDRMPASREIAAHFRFNQTNALNHLRRLEAKGFIELRKDGDRKHGWYRFKREADAV